MTTPTISVIVTFHAEGIVAERSLQGIERLRRYAEREGIVVELVAVLDCADPETVSVVKSSPVLRNYDQVIEVNNRDPGASRNSGIEVARGNFVGIFDGDDYCTENWLAEALRVSMADPGNLIVHPELTISFGTVNCVARSLDMDAQPNYPLQNCLAVHPWIVGSFGARSIYERVPYCRTDTDETGFGFEDWHWNLDIIAAGGRHVSASGTAYYYRTRYASTFAGQAAAGAVIRPTSFFDHPERWNVRFHSHFVPATYKKIVEAKELVPPWAIEGFRQIAEIEPDLYPTSEFLSRFFYYAYPFDLEPGELYAKSFALLGGYCPDTICVVPWLAWGSTGDLAWQEVFARRSAGKKVLVVSTHAEGSQRSRNIPEEFCLLEFGELSHNFSEAQQVMVLTRLVLQSSASEIYVVNSPLGWNLVNGHGKSIMATGKTIYAGLWNQAQDEVRIRPDGKETGRLREYALDQDLDELRIGNDCLAEQRDADAANDEEHSRSARVQMDELRTGIAWFSKQRDAWKEAAESQEAHSKSLELALEEMRIGNAWLLEQRDAWQAVASNATREAERCDRALRTLLQSRVIQLLLRAGVLERSQLPTDPPGPPAP